MQLNRKSLQDKEGWKAAQVTLPDFDIDTMVSSTKEEPIWLHFGAGNIFRAYIAVLQQRLLNKGLSNKGIIAAESFDYDIVYKILKPYDNLTMLVALNANATMDCEIIASIAESIHANPRNSKQMARLVEVFTAPSLQMVSFTITEKGYSLYDSRGNLLRVVEEDCKKGPDYARHAMSLVAAMLYKRYLAGGHPLAVVSMDNCSHNGEKLYNSILTVAKAWVDNGLAETGFLDYLSDESKVSFPWSMIDKITPRPSDKVQSVLQEKGIEQMQPIITSCNTYIAPFVNAERPEYLVIEDSFPNGRPALEKVGVYLTDRETVNKTERMKVTTCLNPLHTAMSIYGCLLGYTRISDIMQDTDIVALIKRLGYVEGIPVVTDPGIFSPLAFIDEVVEERLPNPFIPDTPQRIATDTSQKVGIRFGETIKSYLLQGRDLQTLVSIPLAIAGWLRYLLAVDDEGQQIEVSSDPLKEDLQDILSNIVWDNSKSYSGQLQAILSNDRMFGTDLTKTVLAEKIEAYFIQMLAGKGAIRATLQKNLAQS